MVHRHYRGVETAPNLEFVNFRIARPEHYRDSFDRRGQHVGVLAIFHF